MNRREILIGGGTGVVALGAGATLLAARQMGSASDYDQASRAARRALAAHPDARDLVRFATLAPNGHNTQPWRFTVEPGTITIRPDFTRRTPIVDPDDHHLFVSLGCAAENLVLAAAARGYHGDPSFDASGDGAIRFRHNVGPSHASPLFDAIPHRQSTRADYDGRPTSAADLKLLATAAADIPEVDLILVTERRMIDRIGDLILSGNTTQMSDPAFMRELKSWLRFNPRQALATGDGLYSATTGNRVVPNWLGRRALDLFLTAKSENDKYASQLRSSTGLAVFVAQKADREHWVLAGHACQRFALQATALGLKHAFVNQPVEVAALRPDLASLVGIPGRRPDLVMRFGYGPLLPYSPRRPVASVLDQGGAGRAII